mgnify:FL=1
MNLGMSTTGVLMVIIGIMLLAYEIVAFVIGKRRALISTWFQKLGFRAPAAVFVMGMLAGHFWMYFPPTVDDERVVCPKCREILVLNVDSKTGDVVAELQVPK